MRGRVSLGRQPRLGRDHGAELLEVAAEAVVDAASRPCRAPSLATSVPGCRGELFIIEALELLDDQHDLLHEQHEFFVDQRSQRRHMWRQNFK